MRRVLTFCLLFFLQIKAFGQSNTLTINESFEEAPMLEVLHLLKEKYQLKVAYDYESIGEVKITKQIQSTNIKDALESLFAGTDLTYQVTEDQRILVRKVQALSLSELPSKTFQYTFSGTIIDQQNETPLAFATIFCPDTNEGVSTDENGQFSLTVNSPKESGKLTVQYLGYIPRKFVWQKGTQLTDLQIALQTKSLDFEEVTIIEKLPTIQTNPADGSTVLNADQLRKLPSFGGGNDIFRGLQLLPGIAASDDLSSELRIRGSDGDENMIILDGITLYKVDHFYGIFSAINPSIIDQVKVFKNAFPVEYGGRTAGVIDLTTHDVDIPKIGGSLEADLLTTSAHLVLPINKKMGFLLGGRTTNKNVANTDLFDLIETSEDQSNSVTSNQVSLTRKNPDFKLYDFNAKFLWNINNQTDLSISYFKSYDELIAAYEYQFNTTNNRGNRRDQILNIETLQENAEWDNQGASLQMNHSWTNNLKTNINVAYTVYNDRQQINSTLVREISRRPSPRPGRPPNNEVIKIDTTLDLTNQFSNAIMGAELNLKNAWTIDEHQQLVFGYHLNKNEVSFALNTENIEPISQSEEASQHSIYLQYNLQHFERFNIGLGLRNTYYTLTQKNYLSPRVNIAYQASEQLLWKASVSKYYQFLRTNSREDRFGKTYDFWVLSNGNQREFPVASSEQVMVGFNWKKEGFELDVEAYHKTTDGVTEFAPTANGFIIGEVNTSSSNRFNFYNGTGITNGIDVLFKKDIGKYTGWLSYTLGKMTRKFQQIDRGNPFPAQDDRRHQLKLVNQ
ncbi:MAG: TonB-dependent receptor, partial [Bacteroidota bacterium]